MKSLSNTLFLPACLGLLLGAVALPAGAQVPEVEPNDDTSSATGLVMAPPFIRPVLAPFQTFMAAMSGSISPPGDADFFGFGLPLALTLPAGAVNVYAYVDAPAATTLTLLDARGAVLATLQFDAGYGTGNGGDATVESTETSVIAGALLFPVLPLTATNEPFYLRVGEPGDDGEVPDYTLYFIAIPTAPFPLFPPLVVEIEPNDVPPVPLPLLPAPLDAGPAPAAAAIFGMVDPLAGDPADLFAMNLGTGAVSVLMLDGNPGRPPGGSDDLILSILDEAGVPMLMVNSASPPFIDADPSSEAFSWRGTGLCFAQVSSPLTPGAKDYVLAGARFIPGCFSVSPVSRNVVEGATVLTFTVQRTDGYIGTVEVDYATADGTAVAGLDYIAASGTLTFGPGEMTREFTVTLLEDALTETNETFSLNISPRGPGEVCGSFIAAMVILDNDEPDNNSAATAIPLDLSAHLARAEGDLSPSDDQDWYRIVVPATAPPGTTLTVIADTGGAPGVGATTTSCQLTILSADGTTERESDSGDAIGTGLDFTIETTDSPVITGLAVTPGATYFARLYSRGVVSPYRLAVVLAPPSLSEVEPNGGRPNVPATSFTVQLNGAQEVPPNGSPGTGFGTLALTPTNSLVYSIAYNNLSSDFTMAHLHGPANVGMNGPVIADLINVPSGPRSGQLIGRTTALTPMQLAVLPGSVLYVNIHSVAFPGGEIRGWIGPVPPPVTEFNEIDLSAWPIASRTGQIGVVADQDWYRVSIPGGAMAVVAVDADPERDGLNTDLTLGIIGSDDSTFGVNFSSMEDVSAENPALAEAVSWINRSESPQDCFLRIAASGTGTYRLTVGYQSPGRLNVEKAMSGPCGVLDYSLESAGAMTLNLVRTHGNFGPASVELATVEGTARAGTDFSPVAATVNFANGETRKAITIPLLDDALEENVECFDLSLNNPVGAVVAPEFTGAACAVSTGFTASPLCRLFIVDDDEPENDFYTNAPPLDVTLSVARVAGTVSPWTGDLADWYCITNPQPNSKLWITVDTGSVNGSASGSAPRSPDLSRDSIVAVYRADGSLVAADDDAGSGNGGDSTLESGLASALAGIRLPEAGSYYVAVFAFDHRLGVMKSEPADTNLLPMVDYNLLFTLTRTAGLPSVQPGNTRASATPIVTSCVSVGVRTNSLRFGEERWYSVVASARDELHVSLDGNVSRRPSGCNLADSIVDLIAPNGSTVLFTADSSGCGGAEGFGYVVTSPGTYYIRVRLSSRNDGYPAMGIKLMVARQSSFSGTVQITGADVSVTFPTIAGQTYIVESSEDLRTWTPLPGTLTGSGGPATYVDAGGAGRPARYYRIVATGPAPSPSAPLCLSSPAGLIGWWAGDDNASNLLSGLTGTLQGGMGFTNDGYVASAFHFDGVNDYVRLGDVLNPGTNSFTLNTWFRRTADANNFRLFSKGSSGGYWLSGDDEEITFEVDGGPNLRVTAPLPALNEWHHVSGVLDRAGREVRLYLDGTLYARRTFTNFGAISNSSYLSLGARDRGPGSGSPTDLFAGQMDEAQYHDRALTDCEVGAIYNAGRAGQCKP